MKPFLKRYWLELIVFGAIFGVLLNANLPNFTWINTDSDGPHYILAAKHFLPAHNTSAPLFLLLSHMFLWIPYGTEAWRMGLISVLATVGTAIYIYLIVRHLLFDNPKSRWYALIASVVFGGSALVISQSTIIETYALSTMFIVGAYYYCLKRNWLLASVMIGLTWATHTLFAWMAWVVLLIMYKEMRNVILVFVTLLFLSFYAYIPIVTAINDPPLMWGNTTFSGFVIGNLGTLLMLGGALSIWDLPKRILDTIGILGVSLGLGVIPLVWHFIKVKKWKYGLLWLFLIPVLWFVTNLAAETYVYMFPSIAFGSIVVALGLSKMRKEFAYAVMAVAVGLMAFNAHYFDIGRTCFPRGTRIVIKRKKKTKLEVETEVIGNIKVGDEVLSYNVNIGVKEYKKVTKVYTRKAYEFVTISFSNNNEIRCTPEHPIAVERRGAIQWIQAKDLAVGDKCIQYKYKGLRRRLRNFNDRGRSIEERYGSKKAQALRQQWQEKHQALRRCPTSAYNSKEYAELMSRIVRAEYEVGVRTSWNTGLTKATDERVRKLGRSIAQYYVEHPEAREALSYKQKANWANPNSTFSSDDYWDAYRKGRNTKPSKLEIEVKRLLDLAFPGKWDYVGDYTFPIKGKNNKRRFPDFKHHYFRKLLEAYNDFDKVRKYGSVKQYKQITTNFYHNVGYDVCYLSYDEVYDNPDGVVEKVCAFTYNPHIYFVRVVDIKYDLNHLESVYNLKVEDNNNYYAQGILVHNCDPEMSAVKFYNEELPKIPDGEIFMGGGWTWAMVYFYNMEEGKNIARVSTDALPEIQGLYVDILKEQGIEAEMHYDQNYVTRQAKIMLSVVRLNDGVWIAKETKPEVYEYEIVLARGNEDYVGRWIDAETLPEWRWKPSNPYHFITGALEVAEWNLILQSSRNCLFFVTFGMFGYLFYWVGMSMLKNKRKAKKKEEISDALPKS